MTEVQISKLVGSWSYIMENSSDTGIYFYNQLFTIAPEFKVLFSTNPNQMAEKFMATITVILAKSYKGNSLISDVQHLALRHVGYGVLPEHYALVGRALLTALEYGLKEKWNDELRELWTSLYKDLSEAMIKASYQARDNVA